MGHRECQKSRKMYFKTMRYVFDDGVVDAAGAGALALAAGVLLDSDEALPEPAEDVADDSEEEALCVPAAVEEDSPGLEDE